MGQDKSGNRQRTTGNRGFRDQATGSPQGRKRSQANPARGSGEHHGIPRPNPRFTNSNSRFNRLSARDAALRALQDVVRGDAYASQALDRRLEEARLKPEDRRLAAGLFYSAVENRLYIEHMLSGFLDRLAEKYRRMCAESA